MSSGWEAYFSYRSLGAPGSSWPPPGSELLDAPAAVLLLSTSSGADWLSGNLAASFGPGLVSLVSLAGLRWTLTSVDRRVTRGVNTRRITYDTSNLAAEKESVDSRRDSNCSATCTCSYS